MTNEYGVTLDSNGYAPTIMAVYGERSKRCYMCGKTGVLQRHEIYGNAYRDKSKAYGLWVWLCPDCHHYIHFVDANRRLELKEHGQRAAQKHYGWFDSEFRERFGKCYI